MAKDLDLNLLRVFDALHETGSVTAAAEHLHLSVPATSRALGRLRRAMDDPIFVRAGRGLAPTPFALRAAADVRSLLDGVQALLSSESPLDPSRLERTFTIRINDGPAATLAPALVALAAAQAPMVSIRFAAEGDENVEALRWGPVDLDIGVHQAATSSDLRQQQLYTEQLVGVVRDSSTLARRSKPTLEQLCGPPHVSVSRRGRPRGPLDEILGRAGLTRRIAVVVPSYAIAAMMAAETDLVALLPGRLARHYSQRLQLRWFDVPAALPALPISQQWHARLDHDASQQWLRSLVHAASTPPPRE